MKRKAPARTAGTAPGDTPGGYAGDTGAVKVRFRGDCASGLGPDGHTASLVPGDPVLDVVARDVALTGVYQERRRMTLTYPILDLRAADPSIPAGRVCQERALVLADEPAAGLAPAS